MNTYDQFSGRWGERAQMAWDLFNHTPSQGIPTKFCHVMDIGFMEEMTGHARGDFRKDPETVYLAFQELAGACFIDQYMPDNPLTMGEHGFESDAARTATTGQERIVYNGIEIDSPEAVVEHLERFRLSTMAAETRELEATVQQRANEFLAGEIKTQSRIGTDILKVFWAAAFPQLEYDRYGYEQWFCAYALYPDVMERFFAESADWTAAYNKAIALAIVQGKLPKLIRLDHDMADGRGTMVDIRSLDRIWFPHFAQAIKPFLDAGIDLIWHCDGNLMQMVPRLLECGLVGFQGFQYEHGMDYKKICAMKTRDGRPLTIEAGVSVTTTLPLGTKQDVIDELNFLVEYGPKEGLSLGASSSVAPGTNRENLKTLIEGFKYYRTHGRSGRWA